MSEYSVRTQSKKSAIRDALIAKASSSLAEVKEEELKLVGRITGLTNAASESLSLLIANKSASKFKQLYGDCVVKIQDTLASLQAISILLDEDTNDDDLCEEEIPSAQADVTSELLCHVKEEMQEILVQPVEDYSASQLTDTQSHLYTETWSVEPSDLQSTVPPNVQAEHNAPSTEPLVVESTLVEADLAQALSGLPKPDDFDAATACDVIPAVHLPSTPPVQDDGSRFFSTLQSMYQSTTVKLDDTMDVASGFHQGPNTLWLQISTSTVDRIFENICMGLSNDTFQSYPSTPGPGDIVLAKFDVDQFYYRAVVKSFDAGHERKDVEVFFIDYGNIEITLCSDLLCISEELRALPPQAHLCSLESVSPPALTSIYTDKAMDWFEESIQNPLKARFSLCDSTCPVLLANISAGVKDLSTELIHKGYAIRVTSQDFISKYSNMPKEMKEFYLSVQPQFIKKNKKVFTPTRPVSKRHKESPATTPVKTPAETPTKTRSNTPAKPAAATPAKTMSNTPAKPAATTLAKTMSNTPAKPAGTTLAKTMSNTPATPAAMTPAKTMSNTPAKTSKGYKFNTSEPKNKPLPPPAEAAREYVGESKIAAQYRKNRKIVAENQRNICDSVLADMKQSEETASTTSNEDKAVHTPTRSTTSDASEHSSHVEQATTELQHAGESKNGPKGMGIDPNTLAQLKAASRRLSDRVQRDYTATPNLSECNKAAQRMITHALGGSGNIRQPKAGAKSSPKSKKSSDTLQTTSRAQPHKVGNHGDSKANGAPLKVPARAYPPPADKFFDTEDWIREANDVWEVTENKEPKQDNSVTTAVGNSDTPDLRPQKTAVYKLRKKDVVAVASTATSETIQTAQTQSLSPNPTADTHTSQQITSVNPPTPPSSQEESHQPIVAQITNNQPTKELPVKTPSTPRPITEGKSKSISGEPLGPSAYSSRSKIKPHASLSVEAVSKPLQTKVEKSAESTDEDKNVLKDSDIAASCELSKPNLSVALPNSSPDGEGAKVSPLDRSPMLLSPEPTNMNVTGGETPVCMLSPPQCNGPTVVPPQTLTISNTKESRRVLVSHINTPTDFYVNMCDKQTAHQFNHVLNGINDFYDRLYNSMLRNFLEDYFPKVGDYCVARSDQFKSYYRAEILEFRESKDVLIDDLVVRKKNSKTIKVFFLDYGSSEWVSEDVIFPLMPQFTSVPPLAWQCSLTDVYPVDGCVAVYPGGWDKKAVQEFKSIVPEGAICDVFITNPRAQMGNEMLQVILQLKGDPKFINEELVNKGFVRSVHLHGDTIVPIQKPAADIKDPEDTSDVPGSSGIPTPPDDIADWKPMADDYFSPSNMYSLDPNDAEVILTGYKSKESARAYCINFAKKGYCRRGENCPYEHIKEREGAVTEDMMEVFCTDATVTLPEEGVYCVVELTTTISPSHFYLKFPFGTKSVGELVEAAASDAGSSHGGTSNPETLCEQEDFSDFQARLNEHYLSLPFIRKDSVAYALGEIVVAKYTDDKAFYRARVVESDFDNHSVEVFFVDFGNREWTSHSNIRDIAPRFLHLPFQAVECFMDIEPVDPAKGWTAEETGYFNQLADGKFLVCMARLCNQGANNMTVELIDSSNNKDTFISQAMVEANIAKIRPPLDKSPNTSTQRQAKKLSPYLPG